MIGVRFPCSRLRANSTGGVPGCKPASRPSGHCMPTCWPVYCLQCAKVIHHDVAGFVAGRLAVANPRGRAIDLGGAIAIGVAIDPDADPDGREYDHAERAGTTNAGSLAVLTGNALRLRGDSGAGRRGVEAKLAQGALVFLSGIDGHRLAGRHEDVHRA